MKLLIATLVFLLSSCKSNFQNEMILNLTNNETKCWYIDFGKSNTNIERLTLWCFSFNGDFLVYYYNLKTKKIKIQNHGDYFPVNKFVVANRDTILLNGSEFPIFKLSKDELILREIYSFSFFDDGYMYLRSCSDDNGLFNLNCTQILEKIDALR